MISLKKPADPQVATENQVKEDAAAVDRPIIVDYYIKLENLLEGRSGASIIDLKMGTSTVTCNITSERKLQKRHEKDRDTTSRKLGIRVIGYVIKSREKEIEEKFYKFPYKNEYEIPQVLRRLFSWPRCADCRLADKEMSYACSSFLNSCGSPDQLNLDDASSEHLSEERKHSIRQ